MILHFAIAEAELLVDHVLREQWKILMFATADHRSTIGPY